MASSVDSDATEPNLAFHRDIDPVRMMRTRFADPIRASSPPGLHQQAGHMTASDLCAARRMISCRRGPSTHDEASRVHHATRRCSRRMAARRPRAAARARAMHRRAHEHNCEMIRNSSPASRYSCKYSLSSRESDLRVPCQPTAYLCPKAEDGNRRKSACSSERAKEAVR